VYVAGEAGNNTFPTTPDAYDRTYNGAVNDEFLARVNISDSLMLARASIRSNPVITGTLVGTSVSVQDPDGPARAPRPCFGARNVARRPQFPGRAHHA